MSTGIRIRDIILIDNIVEYNFDVKEDTPPEFDIQILNLDREEHNDNEMALKVTFSIVKEVPACPFKKFSATFIGAYQRQDDGMTWEQFETFLAIAHILPYFREFVSNMTSRMPVPTLYLPPITTKELVERYINEGK